MPVHKPNSQGIARWLIVTLLAIVFLPIAGFALWTWATLNISYSAGERVGYVQKISNKGWACKSWEGELAMVNIPGTTPQIFAFSVRDDAVAKQLMSDGAGKRVALSYEQHRGVPSNCFGETEYFVTGVRVLPN